MRVGAGTSLANDTEVVGWGTPPRQKVRKVFRGNGLGLDFGWRLVPFWERARAVAAAGLSSVRVGSVWATGDRTSLRERLD